jgi:hypothetical protein
MKAGCIKEKEKRPIKEEYMDNVLDRSNTSTNEPLFQIARNMYPIQLLHYFTKSASPRPTAILKHPEDYIGYTQCSQTCFKGHPCATYYC